jgi:hypothetical protein
MGGFDLPDLLLKSKLLGVALRMFEMGQAAVVVAS